MSNPNEDQWNGQTGQPNQSQPNQPNPAGQPGQPQYGAYDSNHGGPYHSARWRERKTLGNLACAERPATRRTEPRTRTTARTPAIRTMARTASRHGGRTVGGIRRTANRIAKRGTGSRWSGTIEVARLAADQLVCRQFQSIPPDRGMAAGKARPDSHHLRRGGAWPYRLGTTLLLVPNKTLALAALLLGVYFVISGVVRIVSALVGGSAGRLACAGRVRRHSADLWRRGGCAQLRHDRSDAAYIYFDGRFRMDYMEGVLSLVESWRIPHSGWAIAYAIISIIAGFVVLMSPLSSAVFMIIFGGCAMVVMGITSVIRAFTFGKRK